MTTHEPLDSWTLMRIAVDVFWWAYAMLRSM